MIYFYKKKKNKNLYKFIELKKKTKQIVCKGKIDKAKWKIKFKMMQS